MKRFVVALVTLVVALLVLAGPASATDVNVLYDEACPVSGSWSATVTLTSAWDGTSHILVNGRTLTVPPRGSASTTFVVTEPTLHVVVGLAPGDQSHLHGVLDTTLSPPSGCVLATTTTAPAETTTVPTFPDSSAPLVPLVPVPPPSPPNVGGLLVLPPERSTPESSPEAPTTIVNGHTTPTAGRLPSTGKSTEAPLALVAVLLVLGAALVIGTRASARS